MDSITQSSNNKRKRQDASLEMKLRACARDGYFDGVRELIEIQRVSIECTCANGITPLMWAAYWGRIQVVHYLIGKGANVDAEDEDGDTALSLIVYDGLVEVAQLLLENDANIEARCYFGYSYYSPLGLAIHDGNVNMVALLLRFGANTEETLHEDETNTAVYFACRYSNAEIVQLLLSRNDGVDINTIAPRSRDNPAMTPLCQACRQGTLHIAQLLIQNGARVIYDGVYPNNPSPLVRAIEKGSLELIQFLLDSSRFSLSANNDNPHPLPEIGRGNHPLSPPLDTALMRGNVKVAELLVEHGALVNDKPFLWKCAREGHDESAHFLLQNGADVNHAESETGQTPLWAAAQHGNANLVKKFLKSGADVSIRDSGGETPIWVAYRRGHKRTVYLLLRTSPNVWSKLQGICRAEKK